MNTISLHFDIKNVLLQKLHLNDMSIVKKYQLELGNWVALALCLAGAIRDYVSEDFGRHHGLVVISTCFLYLSTMLMWVLVFATIHHVENERRFYAIKIVLRSFFYCTLAAIPFSFIGYYLEIYFTNNIETLDTTKFLLLNLLRLVFEFGLVLIFKYSIDSREVAKRYIEEANLLREANTKAQFEILKQQINPHFLFNALSTLKSLIRVQDPNAETFVLSLSDVYRKLLQRREKELIRLSDELEIVNSYLFMQKLRFEENLSIETTIPDNTLALFLPPFALQLLIENTIKHNIISQRKPLTIRIWVDADKKIIVENTLQPKKTPEESTGWGLNNLIERYESFSKKTIEIKQTDTLFSVALPLLEEN